MQFPIGNGESAVSMGKERESEREREKIGLKLPSLLSLSVLSLPSFSLSPLSLLSDRQSQRQTSLSETRLRAAGPSLHFQFPRVSLFLSLLLSELPFLMSTYTIGRFFCKNSLDRINLTKIIVLTDRVH